MTEIVDPNEFAKIAVHTKAEELLRALECQTIDAIPQCIENLRWAIGLLLIPEGRKAEYINEILAKLEEQQQEAHRRPTAANKEPTQHQAPTSDSKLLHEATLLGSKHGLAIRRKRGKYEILRHGIFLSRHRTARLVLDNIKKYV